MTAPDSAAIEELLDRLQPRLRATLSRFRIPPEDAEDILQQTLLTYLYKCESVHDPERWLIGVLRNRCLIYWRGRRRRLYTAVDEALLESVAESAADPQEAADLERDLSVLLAQLPARCRDLLRLRYGQGYKAGEAADRLGYKASSIYKVTERCLAALTRYLVASGMVKETRDD